MNHVCVALDDAAAAALVIEDVIQTMNYQFPT